MRCHRESGEDGVRPLIQSAGSPSQAGQGLRGGTGSGTPILDWATLQGTGASSAQPTRTLKRTLADCEGSQWPKLGQF